MGDALFGETRRGAMDGHPFAIRKVVAKPVDRLAENVEHAPQGFLPHRDGDGLLGVQNLHAPAHPIGGAHGDGAHDVIADVLHDFDDELFSFPHPHFEGGQDLRQTLVGESDIDDRALGLDDFADSLFSFFVHGFASFFHLAFPAPATTSVISWVIEA